jgi:hypothetical protein
LVARASDELQREIGGALEKRRSHGQPPRYDAARRLSVASSLQRSADHFLMPFLRFCSLCYFCQSSGISQCRWPKWAGDIFLALFLRTHPDCSFPEWYCYCCCFSVSLAHNAGDIFFRHFYVRPEDIHQHRTT